MERKGLLFLDYNGTFDDVCEQKTTVFIDALKNYISFYNGNVDICVITSAYHSDNEEISIKGDLVHSLYQLPKPVREKFSFFIENKCQYFSAIDHREGLKFNLLNSTPLNPLGGEKKDGVEILTRMIDKDNQIQTCVFAGDMISDARMLSADVGEKEKLFIFAKKGILKEFDESVPRYKLSLNPSKLNLDLGKDIADRIYPTKKIFISTSSQSFGVGKGLNAVVAYLKYKDSLPKTQQNPQKSK